jgi:hypothetical protein
MNRKLSIGLIGSVGVGLSIVALNLSAFASSRHQTSKAMASISPVEAMRIAEKRSGGRATRATFEFDEGKWVYGVITVKNHKLMETEIDPVSGKVLDTEAVTPDGEAKEVRAEFAKMAASR